MHKEYKRIVETADKAVLFIHGIVGTPNHFKFLVPLVPEDVSVYNILLDGHGKGAKECCGVNTDKNPLHYIGWIPRFLELFSKIRATRKIIELVKIPCVACQSLKDEMVSKGSIALLKKNSVFTVAELKKSGHYYYEKRDLALIKEKFTDFIL